MLIKMKKAFTLVELAIVLVIIGLLVGGVLQGQELIKGAKLTRQIKDWQELKTGYSTFYLKYRHIPGDDAQASSKITGATNSDREDNALGSAGGGNQYTYGSIAGGLERCLFFQHLGLSGLYKFNPTSCASATVITSGETIPQLLGRGNIFWWVTDDYVSSSGNATAGEKMICTGAYYLGTPSASYLTSSNPAALFTEEAYFFDNKLDDGKPLAGKIKAVASTPNALCSQRFDILSANGCKTAGDEYDLTQVDSTRCNLSIKMGF